MVCDPVVALLDGHVRVALAAVMAKVRLEPLGDVVSML